jgi:outer membrane protein assembly factor BamA
MSAFPMYRILSLFLLTAVGFAQSTHKAPAKTSSAGHMLASIHVTGSKRYTPEEIAATTGLEIGSNATEEDFQKAIQKLGTSGLFSNVSYSFNHTPTGTKLDIEVRDAEKMVPAKFENFVWFSDDELKSQIHQRLPLFKGEVPIGGTFSDEISDILQALLVQHNVAAQADYIRDSKEPGGPADAVSFRANGITLEIKEVHFSGAAPDQLDALNTAAEKLEGKNYVKPEVDTYTTSKLLPVYLGRGFLKAEIADPKIKVVGETADSTLIALDFLVTPGPQYKLAGIQWEGNKAFNTEKLQGMIHDKAGDLANTTQLQSDLEAIHHLYGTIGYMTEAAKLTPRFDEAAHTVVNQIAIHEGDVFHLGDLDIQGLDPKATDRLRDAWTLRETDPYDTTYPKRFFEQTVKLLSRDVTWTISIHEGVNEQDKTVDVTLRYGIRPSS